MTSDHKSIINNRSLNAFCCSSFHDLATCSIHLLHWSIHLSIQCRCMIVIRILFYFFFLSLFLFLFHSPKTWLSEYHGNFLLYWNYFSFSLSLFTSVNFWQWHPTNSCAIVILSKLGRFRFNIATYQHILFAFDRARSNSIWLTMKPSKFW